MQFAQVSRTKKLLALALSVAVVGGITLSNASGATASSFVSRNGNQLTLDGKPFRFAGTNMYWLGLNDNIRDASGAPTYPSKFIVDDGFAKAKQMNATVIRSHTLGISVGCAQCIEPTLGVFNDKAFESIDYAVASAAKNDMKLMIPLVDQWNWYHGGKRTFTGWRGYKNQDNVKVSDNKEQEASEHNFYTDPQVVADFEQYVTHVLNHTNSITGIKMKDDPTIAVWETGNEIWDAPPTWTEEIAKHIKVTEGSKQLVADGSAADGMHVAKAAVTAEHVDIVGGHFYPRNVEWMVQDAAIAKANNKAYVVGEWDWTGDATSLAKFLSTIETNTDIAGDMYWVLIPTDETGKPVVHGDATTLHIPGDNAAMVNATTALTAHAVAMKASVSAVALSPTTVAASAPTTSVTIPVTSAPVPTTLLPAANVTTTSTTTQLAESATTTSTTTKGPGHVTTSTPTPTVEVTSPTSSTVVESHSATSTTAMGAAIKETTTSTVLRSSTTSTIAAIAPTSSSTTTPAVTTATTTASGLAHTGTNTNGYIALAFLLLGIGGSFVLGSRRVQAPHRW